MDTPTREYTVYEQAYDYFNTALFLGQLPRCLITLQRKANARGYYSPERFVGRNRNGDRTDEIALNPDTFVGRSDKEILSTLVHEMVHLWQQHSAKPGRGRYHNGSGLSACWHWVCGLCRWINQAKRPDRPSRMRSALVAGLTWQ